MRKHYKKILKEIFYKYLTKTRARKGYTQAEFAELLSMDPRSYFDLDAGRNCCGSLTLIFFLLRCCSKPEIEEFLEEIRTAFENTEDITISQHKNIGSR